MARRGETERARSRGAAAGAARLVGAAACAIFSRRPPEFRWGLAASLTLHVALLLVAVAGAPAPAARRARKAEKVYVVNLASLPRTGAGALATEAAPKGQEPRPTTQRMKKPEEEKKKPEVSLEKPKRKPTPKDEKPKPQPVPTDKVATKSVEPAPVGSRDGAKGASGGALGIPGGGSGIGLAGTGTDSDFPFTYYLIAVRNKIAGRWSPPRGVSAGGAALRVTLHFRILRGGTVMDLEVEQISGVDFYDQSAVRAVQAAMPLPPLPEEFPDEYLGVHFDFQFVE